MKTILSTLQYDHAFLCAAVTAALSTIFLILPLFHRKGQDQTPQQTARKTRLAVCSGVLLCCSAVALFGLIAVKQQGVQMGLYTTKHTTIQKIIDNTKLGHKEDILPADKNELKGKLIMYYKFGCPDCNGIYTEWTQMTNNVPNLYWVSTRSKQGKELLDIYPVQEVPAGIYIKQDGTYIAYVLYDKTKTGEITFQKDYMDKLLSLARQQA